MFEFNCKLPSSLIESRTVITHYGSSTLLTCNFSFIAVFLDMVTNLIIKRILNITIEKKTVVICKKSKTRNRLFLIFTQLLLQNVLLMENTEYVISIFRDVFESMNYRLRIKFCINTFK